MKDKEKMITVIHLVQEKGLVVSQRMKWVRKIDRFIFMEKHKFLGSRILL